MSHRQTVGGTWVSGGWLEICLLFAVILLFRFYWVNSSVIF